MSAVSRDIHPGSRDFSVRSRDSHVTVSKAIPPVARWRYMTEPNSTASHISRPKNSMVKLNLNGESRERKKECPSRLVVIF